ncbi:hemolysin family protein [Haliovirga abyssi]|uniref:Membrane protein n=1 Tax=Haliovirga abyssi TaxID=2996794 RepID=A0AAU9E1D9_9FUSO|nr:hemolysin family protein [Haliovirga abyssi]BDU50190.1 membrane protein [Haliovirga abyssi]
MEEYREFAVLAVLIILSGFFSASETALTAFKRINLKDVGKKNAKVAKLLKNWLRKPNEMLTTILLGNNIVNILASSIATVFALKVIGDKVNETDAIFIVTSVLTIVILIFGEITPKIIAKNYSEKVSKVVISPIYYLSILFYPLVLVLTFISKIISKIFGINLSTNNLLITEEDIKSMVSVGEEEGVIEEEEKEMIHSIFGFGDRTAREVMVPRVSVFAIESNKLLSEVWDKIISMGLSRIPVYEGRIDNIIGVLYLKDILNVIKSKNIDLPVKNYIREAYFIPESKQIIELLQEFKRRRIHMSIVLDEYGGTLGIVTIEDVLEEIVGEINDEYDEGSEQIQKISENEFELDAVLDIGFVNKELEIDIPEQDDYDTLGGYIYYKLGDLPQKGTEIKGEKFDIIVKEIDNHRIEKVVLKKKNEDDGDEKN